MIAICSLLVALSFSQASPAADSAGRVSGRVTVEGTNTPLAGARIMLLPLARPTGPMGPPPQAVTDQDGRYVFGRLAPGSYRIDVQKTGFAPLVDLARARTVQVVSGQSIDGVDFSLQKGAVIAGRVLDPVGEPLADARMMALRRVTPPGAPPRFLPAPGQGQQTNDLGEFRISGLLPGEYYVAAMPRPASMFGAVSVAPPARTAPTARTTIATTFYPGTTDQAAAQSIAVAAGAEVGNIVFIMQSAPAFRVSGFVVDENGNPVAGAMVMLMGDPGGGAMFLGPVGSARTFDNGRFDIDDVPAGNYRATASVPMTASSSGGGGGGFFTSSFSSIGDGVTIDQPTEVVVADADLKGLRVVVRRPTPQ